MIERIITGDLQVNTYLYNYSNKNIVIIDPGSNSDKIEAVISDKGYIVKGIILTHGHFDHIGAVKTLKDLYSTKVLIHSKDSDFLGDEGKTKHKEMFNSITPDPDSYMQIYYSKTDSPDIILNNGDNVLDTDLKVIHTPGHSPGSICLYSKKNSILFSGDTLFAGGLGRTDFVGGNYALLVESLNKLRDLPGNTAVYPGHGPETILEKEIN